MNKVDPKKFSKAKTDMAGEILSDKNTSDLKKLEAIEVLDNWRAAHSYPMHIFKKRLKSVSEKIDKNALSVQRLKRVPSILKKLTREYDGKKATMKLTQMQDIAGCRVVMSNIELANKIYYEEYIKSDIKHQKVNEKNYILNPKIDGYRGIHLIYKYVSDKEGKKDFNGLLIEVQIRSKLQHIWATAVETVDFFTKQAIKSNEGEKDWMEFFKLMSSAFAIMEKTTLIHGTPTNEKELYLKIKELETKLHVITKMKHWRESIRQFDNLKNEINSEFFLLELDTLQEKLNITSYPKRKEKEAIQDYANAEKKAFNIESYDVVLVGADTTADLKKAYPNYFVDTKEFIDILQKILIKY